jgi:hypothetical protein
MTTFLAFHVTWSSANVLVASCPEPCKCTSQPRILLPIHVNFVLTFTVIVISALNHTLLLHLLPVVIVLYIYANVSVILNSVGTLYQETVWSTQHYIQWLPEALSSVVKRPEYEASAEVKNVRAMSPLPSMSSWRSARDNCPFMELCYAAH